MAMFLRRIETAMQRRELSFLGALTTGQRSIVAEGQPFIIEIFVTENKAAEKSVN